MSTDKVERLINLMNALLGAPVPIAGSELRRRVPGYPDNDASFKRAFERDKDELREMGVPLLVETIPASDPPLVGYRIRPQDYELKDPGLDPDELEALNLAAAVVGPGGGTGQRALFKLGGAAPSRAATELPADPDLVATFTALAERRRVEFTYRGERRTVDPYRLEFTRGRWYLNGYDHVREDIRWYRLSRAEDPVTVVGERGVVTRPVEAVAGLRLDPWELGDHTDPERAEVWFDPAVASVVLAELDDAEVVRDDAEGLVIVLSVTNRDGFASWLTAFLDRAEVLGPPELRAHVVAWLEEIERRG